MVPHGVEGAIIGTALYVGNFTIEEALRRRAAQQHAQRANTHDRRARRHLPPQDQHDRPPGTQRLDGRLRDLLAGKKIVMTGVTGFIGEQLLWKILTELPDTTPSVLVRRKGSASARDRMISVVKKQIFADASGGRRRSSRAAGQPGSR